MQSHEMAADCGLSTVTVFAYDRNVMKVVPSAIVNNYLALRRRQVDRSSEVFSAEEVASLQPRDLARRKVYVCGHDLEIVLFAQAAEHGVRAELLGADDGIGLDRMYEQVAMRRFRALHRRLNRLDERGKVFAWHRFAFGVVDCGFDRAACRVCMQLFMEVSLPAMAARPA